MATTLWLKDVNRFRYGEAGTDVEGVGSGQVVLLECGSSVWVQTWDHCETHHCRPGYSRCVGDSTSSRQMTSRGAHPTDVEDALAKVDRAPKRPKNMRTSATGAALPMCRMRPDRFTNGDLN